MNWSCEYLPRSNNRGCRIPLRPQPGVQRLAEPCLLRDGALAAETGDGGRPTSFGAQFDVGFERGDRLVEIRPEAPDLVRADQEDRVVQRGNSDE